MKLQKKMGLTLFLTPVVEASVHYGARKKPKQKVEELIEK